MLVLDRVGKTYPNGVHALDGISLTVSPGEILVVIGGSGSGKSTMLRAISGLDTPSQGRVVLDGMTITAPHEQIGIIFQEPRLLPWLRVADNVGFGLEQCPTAERNARVSARAVALDAGTGDGRLLEVLAPIYERVVAIDRSDAQLARARERAAARGFSNVTFVQGELDAPELRQALDQAAVRQPGRPGGTRHRGGADAVFASRVLHHAPQPGRAVAQLASLCAPGGTLVVIDYARHDDESMREQADVWLGFDSAELRRFARAASLEDVRVTSIPSRFCGDGPDKDLPWQLMVARRATSANGNADRKGK